MRMCTDDRIQLFNRSLNRRKGLYRKSLCDTVGYKNFTEKSTLTIPVHSIKEYTTRVATDRNLGRNSSLA